MKISFWGDCSDRVFRFVLVSADDVTKRMMSKYENNDR